MPDTTQPFRIYDASGQSRFVRAVPDGLGATEVLLCPNCGTTLGLAGATMAPGGPALKTYDREWRGMDISEICPNQKCGCQVTSSTILVAIHKG